MPKLDGLSCSANHTGVVPSCCAMPRPACRNCASSFSLPGFASRRTNNACLIMVDSKVENWITVLAQAPFASLHGERRTYGWRAAQHDALGLNARGFAVLRECAVEQRCLSSPPPTSALLGAKAPLLAA